MKLNMILGMLFVSVMIFHTTLTVFGEETKVELSLEEATKMALAHSTALISENLSAEISKEKMDDIHSEDIGNYNKSQLLSYLKQAANYANSKLSQQLKEEGVALSLKKAYIQAINLEQEIAVEKNSLNISNKELEVSRVKAERGLISHANWQELKLAYEKSKKQLDAKEADLQSSYRALSILIGKDENTVYHLSLEPKYEKLALSLTLEGYINNKIASGLNVQQQIRNVETAESEKRLTTAIISDDNIYANQEATNSLTTAQLTLADTKTQLRDSLLNCYKNIVSLETAIEMNQKELDKLNQDFAIAQTKLKQQTDIQLSADKAEHAVFSMESTITAQIYEHMLLMEQFDKSYLL